MSKQDDARHYNSSTSLFFERSKSEKVLTQATKRSSEETDNPVTVANTSEKTTTTSKANSISYYTQQKGKGSFKLNYLNEKKARYESHYEFITRCQKEKVIPDGLKVYLERSSGNHSERFLNNWHEKLQTFYSKLMSDVLTFCEKTIETVSLEIKETQHELNKKLENEEREEINATLRKNDEIN